MAKYKPGLHKKISSIFDGAPISPNGEPQKNTDEPTPKKIDKKVVKPIAKDPQTTPNTKPQQKAPTWQMQQDESTPKIQKPLSAPEPKQAEPTAPKTNQASVVLQSKPTPQPKQKVIPTFEIAQTSSIVQNGKDTTKALWMKIRQQLNEKLFAPKPGVDVARQKKIAIFVPILSIIFIVMMAKTFNNSSKGTGKDKMFGPSKAIAGVDTKKSQWSIPDVYPKSLRDPMKIGSMGTGNASGGLIVKGIVYSHDNPAAVVGGQIVHEGDMISKVKVVKIHRDSVEFVVNGKRVKKKVQR